MPRRCLCALLVVAGVAAGCDGSSDPSPPRWTEAQAESVSRVRSLPVRNARCRGVGRPAMDDGVRTFARFECVAGGRAPWQRYDTIAVFYVLRPLEAFDRPRSRHRLAEVRFVGGPGIP
jgi:hypothetical protein